MLELEEQRAAQEMDAGALDPKKQRYQALEIADPHEYPVDTLSSASMGHQEEEYEAEQKLLADKLPEEALKYLQKRAPFDQGDAQAKSSASSSTAQGGRRPVEESTAAPEAALVLPLRVVPRTSCGMHASGCMFADAWYSQ